MVLWCWRRSLISGIDIKKYIGVALPPCFIVFCIELYKSACYDCTVANKRRARYEGQEGADDNLHICRR